MEGGQVVIVAITGASGVLGALAGGYFQARVGEKAIDVETARHADQTKEEHFRHRQGVFNDALRAMDQYFTILEYPSKHSRKDLQTCRDVLLRALTGAMLFGDEEVSGASRRALDFVGAVGLPTLSMEDVLSAGEKEDWLEVRDDLMTAMRTDLHR